MPDRYEVDVRDVLRQFRRMGGDMPDLVRVLNADAAQVVEKRAKQIVPVRSGTLKGDIRFSGTKTAGVVRAGRAKVPYAGPVHYGWPKHNIKANPFLSNALDDKQADVYRVYENGIARLIRKHT